MSLIKKLFGKIVDYLISKDKVVEGLKDEINLLKSQFNEITIAVLGRATEEFIKDTDPRWTFEYHDICNLRRKYDDAILRLRKDHIDYEIVGYISEDCCSLLEANHSGRGYIYPKSDEDHNEPVYVKLINTLDLRIKYDKNK